MMFVNNVASGMKFFAYQLKWNASSSSISCLNSSPLDANTISGCFCLSFLDFFDFLAFLAFFDFFLSSDDEEDERLSDDDPEESGQDPDEEEGEGERFRFLFFADFSAGASFSAGACLSGRPFRSFSGFLLLGGFKDCRYGILLLVGYGW